MHNVFRIALLLTLITAAFLFLPGCAACADTLVLPNDLLEIGEAAFYGDSSLDEVVIPQDTTDIGPSAFAYSSVRKVLIPDSVRTIGGDAFAGTNVIICSSLTGFAKQYADDNGLLWMDSSPAAAVNLTLAHNMATNHPVHIALTAWAEAVEEASEGGIVIEVVPEGRRGYEADCLSQVQTGALEMTKANAGTLSNYSAVWNCVAVPYLFKDKDHLYAVMNGDIGRDLFRLTENDGFVGLAWLETGSRSFYTVSTPIRTPSDLNGLKIRTMSSQMSVDMLEALGASAVFMAYSDIPAAMQQGAIDGAENTISALRDHADVTGYYCYDEHTMIPDVIVISSAVWDSLSSGQQAILRSTAADLADAYRELWAQTEEELRTAVSSKVTFVADVDKAAFREAVQPIYDHLGDSDPAVYAFVERIQAAADPA